MLSLATANTIVMIDMINLDNSQAVDSILSKVFGSRKTTFVGFDLLRRLPVFLEAFEDLKFARRISKILELKRFSRDAAEIKGKNVSLSAVCEIAHGKKLCGVERSSNFDARPLRFSQEHFLAIDV